MPCALCLKDAELRRSHIIPEFLYESIYDDKHRLQVLSLLPDQPNWREQKGLREQLLCDACEQKISVWERYASLLLKGGTPIQYRREGRIICLSGLDYEKFKLFQLSVLWRAGASSLPFFKEVQLGPHAEKLRRQLLAGDPGSEDRYGCVMFGISANNRPFTDVIMQPGKVRLNGYAGYKFVFGGFLWSMLVSSHDIVGPMRQCILRRSGETVLMVRDALEMDNLRAFSEVLLQMGRAP